MIYNPILRDPQIPISDESNTGYKQDYRLEPDPVYIMIYVNERSSGYESI